VTAGITRKMKRAPPLSRSRIRVITIHGASLLLAQRGGACASCQLLLAGARFKSTGKNQQQTAG